MLLLRSTTNISLSCPEMKCMMCFYNKIHDETGLAISASQDKSKYMCPPPSTIYRTKKQNYDSNGYILYFNEVTRKYSRWLPTAAAQVQTRV
jgi:hypothetical protein